MRSSTIEVCTTAFLERGRCKTLRYTHMCTDENRIIKHSCQVPRTTALSCASRWTSIPFNSAHKRAVSKGRNMSSYTARSVRNNTQFVDFCPQITRCWEHKNGVEGSAAQIETPTTKPLTNKTTVVKCPPHKSTSGSRELTAT